MTFGKKVNSELLKGRATKEKGGLSTIRIWRDFSMKQEAKGKSR
jgi:hypothetical protein